MDIVEPESGYRKEAEPLRPFHFSLGRALGVFCLFSLDMDSGEPAALEPAQNAQIERWLRALTLEEKAALVSGSGLWHTTPIARLGIPTLKVTDGPNGARGDGQARTLSRVSIRPRRHPEQCDRCGQ